MRHVIAALIAATLAAPALAADSTEIGHVNTALTNLGLTRSHRVVVERFEDPDVAGVACYISQARTGGISGTLGLAEDPARFSLMCTAVGPVKVGSGVRRGDTGEQVFETSTSLFFKETKVRRFFDEERGVVVYLAWSTLLVDGSPYNAIAVVPVR